VGGVDAVDGTPVYDVKPYLPWCEAPPGATSDWASDNPLARAAEAVVIPPAIAAELGPATTTLVGQLLRLELQPAYQHEPDRIYGMTVASWNIRWRTDSHGAVHVFEAQRK
jgi:hypothetical protein